MEERLKKFTRLVDAGTFTAAASQLHTSQPALTTAIQKLAREMKTELFVQGSRSLQLTLAGQIAYEHGQQLLTAEKNLRSRLQRLAEEKQPLALGSIDSIARVLVAADLLPILERDSELSLVVQNSRELATQLSKGRLDMVIVAEQRGSGLAMTDQRKLGNERFALVCSAAQAERYESAKKQGSLPDFLAYNLGSTTYGLLQEQLAGNALSFEPRLYSTDPSVLLQLALQGKGVAALPVSLIESHLVSKDLVELELKKPLQRPIVALWQTGHKLPNSVEDFLDATQIQLI